MKTEYLRKHTRYALGSIAVFETGGGYYSGGVLNSSMGGIFFEPNNGSPEVSAGDELSITLDDIFTDKKCSFHARVVRTVNEGVALSFIHPLSQDQEGFLLNWFSMLGIPGSDTEH